MVVTAVGRQAQVVLVRPSAAPVAVLVQVTRLPAAGSSVGRGVRSRSRGRATSAVLASKVLPVPQPSAWRLTSNPDRWSLLVPWLAWIEPAVALDVDPGVGVAAHAGAVEGVVGDDAAGGALLDVDRLGGGRRVMVLADDDVAVAAVGLAAGDVAPVALRAADVDALAELLPAQPGVGDGEAADHVAGAVRCAGGPPRRRSR